MSARIATVVVFRRIAPRKIRFMKKNKIPEMPFANGWGVSVVSNIVV